MTTVMMLIEPAMTGNIVLHTHPVFFRQTRRVEIKIELSRIVPAAALFCRNITRFL